MFKNFVKPVIQATVLAIGVLALAQPNPVERQQLVGKWSSPALENLGQIYGTRQFVFGQSAWSLVFTAYGDANAKLKLFTLSVGGQYHLGASSSVANATEAVFLFHRRSVRAESAAGVGLFASMGCSLELGQAKDLSSQGCGFLPSLMSAAAEYDLVSLQNGKLFLGDRSGDLSKARPSKLGTDGLAKR
jgi:hypothetical protein